MLTDLCDRYDLSEAVCHRLEHLDAELIETSAHTNLIARSTVDDRFERHYADSLQLLPLFPTSCRRILDIGSGGGFPALPLAAVAMTRHPTWRFTLVESVGKKAAYLRRAAARAGLSNVTVIAGRAERMSERFDVVTARAVAALPALLDLAVPRLSPGGTFIVPKGRQAEAEVTAASSAWHMTAKRVKSATDPEATILLLTDLERRS